MSYKSANKLPLLTYFCTPDKKSGGLQITLEFTCVCVKTALNTSKFQLVSYLLQGDLGAIQKVCHRKNPDF